VTECGRRICGAVGRGAELGSAGASGESFGLRAGGGSLSLNLLR
jgi:hypothetical protein